VFVIYIGLHFNKPNTDNILLENRLTVLDTIKIDDHLRLTLTKRIREIFLVKEGDILTFNKDNMDKDNKLIIKVQREDTIIDTWILKRDTYKSNTYWKLKNTDKKRHDKLHNHKNFMNILLVEDEEDLLFTYDKVLSLEGYNVKSFVDSQKALNHLMDLYKKSSNYYDLIITDVRMPNINGIQLYQILKILNPACNILFVTGLDAMDEIFTLVPTISPENVLKKPFGNEHLIQKIQDMLN
jgi:CheY-like chemotaxis protein